MKHGPWPGSHKVVCDVCGFEFASTRVKERWDGLIVCEKDYEQDHPQKFIRVYENSTPPEPIRPEPSDVFVNVCWVWTVSAYTDLATADCALADNTTLPYAFLLALKGSN